MTYRDSLEAAQMRIAHLETQFAELLAASEQSSIDRQNLEADLAIQKMKAEREIAQLTQQAEVEEVMLRETTETTRIQLESKIRVLEAALQAAKARIAALETQLAAK